MIKRLMFAAALAAASLSACAPPQSAGDTPVASLPGATQVCAALRSDKFDLVLRSYGAATDAVNLLVDAKALKPGSAKAVAVANANDKVLSALAVAENARRACNAASYTAALNAAGAAIAEFRAALHS